MVPETVTCFTVFLPSLGAPSNTEHRPEVAIKSEAPKPRVPIPWFTETDYVLIRAVMSDGCVLPESYDRWQFAAETEERERREEGMLPTRVVIVPGKFAAWRSERMLDLTTAARRQYAQKAIETLGY